MGAALQQQRFGICHVLGLVGITAIVSCSEPLSAPKVSTSDLIASLTPEAASSLNNSGEFIVAGSADAGSTEISSDRARELALAIWQSHEAFVRTYAEADRGAPIARSGLEACPRAYYAESAHEPLDESFPQQIRRHYGAQWLVGLCHGGEQQVAIAIAATATNLTYVRSGGRVRFLGARSGDFTFLGVQPGSRIPVVPEVAVVLAARETGRRIAKAPKLQLRAAPHSALNSVWTVELENAVESRGMSSNTRRAVREISIGHFDGWIVPRLAVSHPGASNADVTEKVVIRDHITGSDRSFNLRRRNGVSKRLEPVTFEER